MLELLQLVGELVRPEQARVAQEELDRQRNAEEAARRTAEDAQRGEIDADGKIEWEWTCSEHFDEMGMLLIAEALKLITQERIAEIVAISDNQHFLAYQKAMVALRRDI